MSEEKIIDSDTKGEDVSYIETYIRFNDEDEKDFCFQISAEQKFRDLFKIFKSLPVSLRPNLFYSNQPTGFKVSTCPGYLTNDGYLLFSYEVNMPKFQRNVSLDSKVSDEIWPGQLILPVWEFNYFYFYSFIAFLLTWLYTDLPDFISPTPGICLTNQVARLTKKIGYSFGFEKIVDIITEGVEDELSIPLQIIVFVIHICKCGIIFLVLNTGVFNPMGFSIRSKKVPDISKDDLLQLGWTGSRRATPEEYKEYYREYKIKQHGGLVKAHQAGLFASLKSLGVFLGEGEGFNTPLDEKVSIKDLLDEDNTKFKMSEEYLSEQATYFATYIQRDDVDLGESVKQYRRYGLLSSTEVEQKIVKQRMKHGDSPISKN